MPPRLTHHPSLKNDDYHSLAAVSPSGLKVFARSPLHYYDQFLAPDREVIEPTPQMQLGTCAHTAILEPHLFSSQVVVAPDFNLRSKAGKEEARIFAEASEGKIVLSRSAFDSVRRMADAVHSHREAAAILSLPGRREATYTWTDHSRSHPIDCKTRPDYHTEDRSMVVDIKTTKDASRAAFERQTASLGYHVQAAWNVDALGAEFFLTIAVESTRPFAVAVYPASQGLLDAGRRRISFALGRLAECLASGEWPGYGESLLDPLDLPRWNHD